MTEREKLIEAMARAISDAQGFPANERFSIGHQKFPNETMANWENYTDEARAALAAIEAMGAVVVPVEATEGMDELCCDAMASGIIVGGGFVEFSVASAQNAWSAMCRASPYAKETRA